MHVVEIHLLWQSGWERGRERRGSWSSSNFHRWTLRTAECRSPCSVTCSPLKNKKPPGPRYARCCSSVDRLPLLLHLHLKVCCVCAGADRLSAAELLPFCAPIGCAHLSGEFSRLGHLPLPKQDAHAPHSVPPCLSRGRLLTPSQVMVKCCRVTSFSIAPYRGIVSSSAQAAAHQRPCSGGRHGALLKDTVNAAGFHAHQHPDHCVLCGASAERQY